MGIVNARAGGSGYRWYLAGLLAAAHLLSFVDRNVMGAVLEPLKGEHALSDAMLGLLQGTGFAVLYGVATIPLGAAADRFSRRGLIAAGMVIWSLATAACGLAGSSGGLFAARVMVGLGEAALVPAAMSLLAAEFPRAQLGRAVALFTGGASLGRSVALAGGGALLLWFTAIGGLSLPAIGTIAPWRAVFVVLALPGLALALAMLTVREAPRVAPERRGNELRAYLAAHRATWLPHFASAACIVLVIQSTAAWAPSYYIRNLAMTPARAGLALGAVLLIAAPLGHLCGGILTDRLQRRGVIAPAAPAMMIGLAGAIPFLWGFVAIGHEKTSLICFGLANFFATLASPAALAGVQMLAPDGIRGRLTALFLGATTLAGIGLGPPLVGLASDAMGGATHLGLAMAIILSLFAVMGVALAWASRAAIERRGA